ncbi:hypothetical protein M0802_012638 [Mischocyttarus mexicanus]|nr:hypothetical protein M0802_012638 [Mischocyttarus mexicanus]
MSLYSGSILFSCSSKAPLSRGLPCKGVTSIGCGTAHGLGSSESYESEEEGGDDSGGVGEGAGDERGDCSGEADGDREREGSKEGPGGGGNEDVSFDGLTGATKFLGIDEIGSTIPSQFLPKP